MIELRGNSIGMVPQDPMSNLNPVWKIGDQVRETLKANGLAERPRRRARKVLSQAGLPDAGSRAKQYPHEFSGGMRQRALIAIGLCLPAAPAHRGRADLGARRHRAARRSSITWTR